MKPGRAVFLGICLFTSTILFYELYSLDFSFVEVFVNSNNKNNNNNDTNNNTSTHCNCTNNGGRIDVVDVVNITCNNKNNVVNITCNNNTYNVVNITCNNNNNVNNNNANNNNVSNINVSNRHASDNISKYKCNDTSIWEFVEGKKAGGESEESILLQYKQRYSTFYHLALEDENRAIRVVPYVYENVLRPYLEDNTTYSIYFGVSEGSLNETSNNFTLNFTPFNFTVPPVFYHPRKDLTGDSVDALIINIQELNSQKLVASYNIPLHVIAYNDAPQIIDISGKPIDQLKVQNGITHLPIAVQIIDVDSSEEDIISVTISLKGAGDGVLKIETAALVVELSKNNPRVEISTTKQKAAAMLGQLQFFYPPTRYQQIVTVEISINDRGNTAWSPHLTVKKSATTQFKVIVTPPPPCSSDKPFDFGKGRWEGSVWTPEKCIFRNFTLEQIGECLNKLQHVKFIGDSTSRSIYLLLRKAFTKEPSQGWQDATMRSFCLNDNKTACLSIHFIQRAETRGESAKVWQKIQEELYKPSKGMPVPTALVFNSGLWDLLSGADFFTYGSKEGIYFDTNYTISSYEENIKVISNLLTKWRDTQEKKGKPAKLIWKDSIITKPEGTKKQNIYDKDIQAFNVVAKRILKPAGFALLENYELSASQKLDYLHASPLADWTYVQLLWDYMC